MPNESITGKAEEGRFRGLCGNPPDLAAFDLDTGRIRLRSISMDDAEDIFREFTPAITKYMGPTPADCVEQTRAWIELALRLLHEGSELQLVVLAGTGEFLGCCGLHGRGKIERPELGIWIKGSAHGNGYGREAITALKQWADKNIQFEYLTYPVDRRNVPSRRIPESLGGFVFDESRFQKTDGSWLDLVVYKILPVPSGLD